MLSLFAMGGSGVSLIARSQPVDEKTQSGIRTDGPLSEENRGIRITELRILSRCVAAAKYANRQYAPYSGRHCQMRRKPYPSLHTTAKGGNEKVRGKMHHATGISR